MLNKYSKSGDCVLILYKYSTQAEWNCQLIYLTNNIHLCFINSYDTKLFDIIFDDQTGTYYGEDLGHKHYFSKDYFVYKF